MHVTHVGGQFGNNVLQHIRNTMPGLIQVVRRNESPGSNVRGYHDSVIHRTFQYGFKTMFVLHQYKFD